MDLVLATRPNASTGIERYAINLFRALNVAERARAHAISVVAFVDDRSTVLNDLQDGSIIKVPGGFRGWLGLSRTAAWDKIQPRALVCPAFPPSPLLSGPLLFAAKRTPIYRIIHDDFPWTRGQAMNLRGRMLFKHAETHMAPCYHDIMAPTALMAESLTAILRRPVSTIGNAPGIDLSTAPAADRRHPGVIAVGTIEPRKNYGALVGMADALPAPWVVSVVGRSGWGPVAAEWESQLAERRGRLQWHGHASDAALLALYQQATCFVSMSVAEGFNMPLVEAGSLGLPVVCSDIEIHRRVAPSWARFVPLSIDAASLARTVVEAAALPPDAKEVATYRHQFSWDGIAQDLLVRIG